MRIYRGYTHPDNPTVYRVLGLEAPDDAVKYSRELKTACLLAAGPQPKAPEFCPRCHQAAMFQSNLCYKFGLAGAWNMICSQCHKVHIPTQAGPTDEDLEGIESIRDRDRETQRAQKDAKARARANKKAGKEKKPRERAAKVGPKANEVPTGDPAPPKKRPRTGDAAGKARASKTGVSDEHCPFGMISNALTVDRDVQSPGREDHVVARQERLSFPAVTTAQNTHQANRPADIVETFDPDVRSIVLILWEKAGQRPFIDRVAIPSHDELFLYHNPRVRAIPAPTEFERYVFRMSVWSPVPWDISHIEVEPEDDIIFVRVIGIQCRDFGQHLHDYQLDHGHALGPQHRLKHIIYEPPHRHRWVLVWHADRAPPHVFLVDSTLVDDPRNNARVPRPWLELLRDAPFLLIWHQAQTRWHGFLRNQSPGIRDEAPMVLLANPCLDTLNGSGEAIAWLDAWCAKREAQSAPAAPLRTSRARSGRRRSHGDSPNRPRTYGKRRMSSAQLTSLSDDEPEFVDDVPAKSSLACTSRRTTGAKLTAPLPIRASYPAQLTSDDEPEFVQGSSSTPMKAKKAKSHIIELDSEGHEIIDLTDL